MAVDIRWLRDNQIIEAVYKGDSDVKDAEYLGTTLSQMLQDSFPSKVYILIDTSQVGKVDFKPSDLFKSNAVVFLKASNLVYLYVCGTPKNYETLFYILISVSQHLGVVRKPIKTFPTCQEALAHIESQLE
ncbi:MAG: hypothetical protein ACOYL5_04355 [Phototrophicaceae bacterium]|jgi:hypothetical protein